MGDGRDRDCPDGLKELFAIETVKTGSEQGSRGRGRLDECWGRSPGCLTDQRHPIARQPIGLQRRVSEDQPFGPGCDLSLLFFHLNFSFDCVASTLANHGGGPHQEEDAGSGALAAGRPVRAEAQREGTARRDPLLFSDGPATTEEPLEL